VGPRSPSLEARDPVKGEQPARARNGHVDTDLACVNILLNLRAAAPDWVKSAVPLPFGFAFTSSMACFQRVGDSTTRTGPKISVRRSACPGVRREDCWTDKVAAARNPAPPIPRPSNSASAPLTRTAFDEPVNPFSSGRRDDLGLCPYPLRARV